MIRRGKPPREGQWSIPGGKQKLGETWRAAAAREVKEETTLTVQINKLQGVYSGIGPVILAVYQATTLGDKHPIPNHETLEVDWFNINTLPDLPFPHDDNIIHDFKKDHYKSFHT